MSDNVIGLAASRRAEVFDAVNQSAGTADAVAAIARVLDVDTDAARRVLDAPLGALVGAVGGGDAAAGGFELQSFRADDDAHTGIYRDRSRDADSATGGEWSDEQIAGEQEAGVRRMADEAAMWFVAVDTVRGEPVGLVFGEQDPDGTDIDVAVWIAPAERRRGYGMRALRAARRELAAYFPGAHLVVRAAVPGGK